MIRSGEHLREGLLHAGKRVVLYEFSGEGRTGDETLLHIESLASALQKMGYTGKKIGLWYPNSFAALEAFAAVELAGATRVPVDPAAPTAEAEAVFEAAGVEAVLTEGQRAAGLKRQVLTHDAENPLRGKGRCSPVDVPDDHCMVLYPRAVTDGQLFAIPVSYANWRATMESSISLLRGGRYGPWSQENECFLSAQNIMHGTGFLGTFPFLEMGLPQVLAPPFDAAQTLDAIERFRVTTTVLVGPMLGRLTHAAATKSRSASSLKHVMYGGCVVRPDEIRRSMQHLGPVLVQGYGRIEGGWPITVLDLEDHQRILAGDDEIAKSCGRPVAGIELKLRKIDTAPDGVGELCVRSRMTVKEYSTPDGWCSLGDLMSMDDRGYLYYRGRLDRMINTGYHVYPDEIEGAILKVPGIADARVVGEANGGLETIVAFVVGENGAPQDELVNRIKTELRQRLARYKIPSQIRVVEILPEH